MKPTTFAQAASIYHRFYNNLEHVEYDEFAIASAAIFLASKVNEDPIRLKDVINVTQVTLDRDEWNNEVANDGWLLRIRDTVIQCEMFIIRVLHFLPYTRLPHFFLLNYLSTLENCLPDEVKSQTPLAKCAMSLLQDFYFSPSIVRHKPEEAAVAILVLTCQIYGLKVPLTEDTENWYRSFCPETRIDTIWEIIDDIMKIYEIKE